MFIFYLLLITVVIIFKIVTIIIITLQFKFAFYLFFCILQPKCHELKVKLGTCECLNRYIKLITIFDKITLKK
jgi:hypothetical protein